jgi:hypothetical protein
MRRGAEYVSGLRDGRVVFLHGKPVEDVTTHPGFAPAIRTIASLYDGMANRPDLVVDDEPRALQRHLADAPDAGRPAASLPGAPAIGPRERSGSWAGRRTMSRR